MKIPLGIALKLLELKQGMRIPYSKLKHPAIDSMIENGIVSRQIIGPSKALIYLLRPEALKAYLINHYSIGDLDEYITFLRNESHSRAEAVDVAADSKIRPVRTFRGFLVSSTCPVECTFKDSSLTINPIEGTFTFIYDYESFMPNKEVTVIGIENPEVFRKIHRCEHLFNQKDILFVCRYPQTKDLVKWLKMIPNNYLHFGDLDYAGINIYLNEYKKHLGERATFFIPVGVEQLIDAKGNRRNFQRQTILPDPNNITEPGITKLIELIGKYKKGLEQEIFVL